MYTIVIDTLCQGNTLFEGDEHNKPVLYDTKQAADAELADYFITLLEQVKEGEREFDDINFDEVWVEPVTVLENGDIVDGANLKLGNIHQPRD